MMPVGQYYLAPYDIHFESRLSDSKYFFFLIYMILDRVKFDFLFIERNDAIITYILERNKTKILDSRKQWMVHLNSQLLKNGNDFLPMLLHQRLKVMWSFFYFALFMSLLL